MADRKGKCPMVRIAILEDDAQDLASLEKCLQQYETEQQKSFSLHSFSVPAVFLEGNISDYDLIFLDIDLPTMTGMDLARQIRQRDSLVTLVFVTNLEKYAVNGYEVDALDFVVKPINYYRFTSMLRRALRSITARQPREVIIQTAGGITRLNVVELYYVEIRDHLLIYHTEQGNLNAWGKMSDVEAQLVPFDFARCSTSHLVNLRYVDSVSGSDVLVAGTRLPISQRRRKAFYTAVTSYLSRK